MPCRSVGEQRDAGRIPTVDERAARQRLTTANASHNVLPVNSTIEPKRRSPVSEVGVGLAATAVAIGLVGIVVAMSQPFGFTIGDLLAQREVAAGAVVVSIALAVASSRRLLRASRRMAVGIAVMVAAAWWPAATLVVGIAAVIDGAMRGAASPVGLVTTTAVWVIYGLVIGWIVTAPFVGIATLAWAVVARSIAKVVRPRQSRRMLAPAVAFLITAGVGGGVAQALATRPLDARCVSLGARVADAAFSPAGDMLAVIVSDDPNAPSSIRLLRWPEATEIARWSAWADDDVAVSPDGQVFWSAWVLGALSLPSSSATEGVLTARVGTEPTWFATDFEAPLNDLTWTEQGLMGTTPNSHLLARVSEGDVGPDVLDPPRRGELGAFWASPNGSVIAVGPGYDDLPVLVSGLGNDRRIDVLGDPRSIAITPDHRVLIAADWTGGTYAYPLEGGAPTRILGGTQPFIIVSARGDLVWTDEMAGGSPLCTMPLGVPA